MTIEKTYLEETPVFLTPIIKEIELSPDMLCLCAGHEDGSWRATGLAHHLMGWLPEFALQIDERKAIPSTRFWDVLRQASRRLYQAGKPENRGELGELLLHIACRQEFGTYPAISKVYYKSSTGETVKGFDVAHTRYDEENDGLELWLGEAKFYGDAKDAVSKAVASLLSHLDRGFLTAEKQLIFNKVNPATPGYRKIQWLLDVNTTLDELISRLVVPVLITYDSAAAAKKLSKDEYLAAVRAEIDPLHNFISQQERLKAFEIHCVYVPLGSKASLVTSFDAILGVT